MRLDEQGDDLVWRASEIDRGLQCMRQLGYSRLGVVAPETGELVPQKQRFSWSLIGGLSMDDVLSGYERQRMDNAPIDSSLLPDLFRLRMIQNAQTFSERGDIVQNGENDSMETMLHDGTKLLNKYVTFSKDWKPLGVQVEAKIQLGDVTLVGHIDYIRQTETNKIIGDWKFTGKSANQMPASSYSRGWAYDLMAGDGSGHIELVNLRRGLKTPKIETSSHFVTKAQHEQVKQTVTTLARLYKERYFPMADPNHWICSPKFCGFWDQCRGNPNGPAKIPGERS